MPPRQPLPRLWLMTDERMPDVMAAIRALPPGSGIVFRHNATAIGERRALFKRIRHIATRRRLCLLLAATPALAQAWGADGAHHRSLRQSRGLRSVAVHTPRERMMAARVGADLIFVSPVFATRSHPTVRPLGPVGTAILAGTARCRAIALGGLSDRNWKRVRRFGFYGWAAIDALSQNQK